MLTVRGEAGEAARTVVVTRFGGDEAGRYSRRSGGSESEVSRTSCSCDDGCGGWHGLVVMYAILG